MTIKVRCIEELWSDKEAFTVGNIYEKHIDRDGHYEAMGWILVTNNSGKTLAYPESIFEYMTTK